MLSPLTFTLSNDRAQGEFESKCKFFGGIFRK